MSNEREHDLIMTIVNRGFSDTVIEASRSAGAQGGTVFYARGTGIHELEKFFGISVQPEKEVVFNLVSKKITKKVMHAIVDAVGLTTPGKGLSFALPVEDVVGIIHVPEIQDDQED